MPKATVPLVAADASPALSQMGGSWPTDGRVVGIVADGGTDPDGVRAARQAVLDPGTVPLIIAPAGGMPDADGDPVEVQRTFATARSVEFDAVLSAGAPAPAADAHGAREAKARNTGNTGSTGKAAPDPGSCSCSPRPAGTARRSADGTGRGPSSKPRASHRRRGRAIIVSEGATEAVRAAAEALAGHRAWDRFPPAL
ncbi:type 1 glutamine amidotransferase family protein [Streptomyces lavendulae]